MRCLWGSVRPGMWLKDQTRTCSAPRAGCCLVPWGLSPLADTPWADGAGGSMEAAAPQKLPGPQHGGAWGCQPQPCSHCSSSLSGPGQSGEEPWKGHRGWPQSPPGRPHAPLVPVVSTTWGWLSFATGSRWGGGCGAGPCGAELGGPGTAA